MSIDNQEIGSVKINIFDLATGPCHNDFLITLKKYNSDIRLIFDISMH